MTETPRERLVKEAKRIEEFSLWNAAAHFTTSGWASAIQTLGGAVPIILGAIGGWKFFADPSLATTAQLRMASLVSLAGGTVGSLLAYWNIGRARLEHFQAGTKYKSLENEARRAREIYAVSDEDARFRERVEELMKRYDALGESSPQSLTVAFRVAGWKVRRGRYAPDRPTDSHRS